VDSSLREDFFRNWFAEWAPEMPVHGWATQLLVHQIEEEPEEAWDLILGLVARASDDDSLGWVAAGPLEDLLCEHGKTLIDRVERRARTDAKFNQCLKGVWGSNRMEPSVYERIVSVAPGNRPVGERA
jgi:hypothetical protein